MQEINFISVLPINTQHVKSTEGAMLHVHRLKIYDIPAMKMILSQYYRVSIEIQIIVFKKIIVENLPFITIYEQRCS